MVDRKTEGRLRSEILGRLSLLIAKGVNDVTLLLNYVTLSLTEGCNFVINIIYYII